MSGSIIKPSINELSIIQNNRKIKEEKHDFVDYKNQVCIKPWGHEFLIHVNKKVGIWFLKINKGNQTSLHTHFNKDTLLIAFKGTAKINLFNNKSIILNEMEYIYIPKYCFHGISSFSDYSLLVEIEVYDKNIDFSDKNDLLRIQDIYDRENIGYATSVNISKDLVLYDYFYLDSNTKKQIECNEIFYKKLQNPSELDDKYLNILIQGEVFMDGIVAKEGTLLKKGNRDLYFLSEQVYVLSLYSKDKKENSKIIYDLEHLNLIIQDLQSSDKKVILSSGCFDILHVGHLNTLKIAKNLGDILMVCLSSDEQIKKLKGHKRPINNYQDRIDLFKTISYVDYIIIYDEENIEKEKTLDDIMKRVNPFAWVKGNDYDKEDILKKHPHLQNIVLLENIANKSTTHIIKNINGN